MKRNGEEFPETAEVPGINTGQIKLLEAALNRCLAAQGAPDKDDMEQAARNQAKKPKGKKQ